MSTHDILTQNSQNAELLRKTADFYRWSITHYEEFAKTERKPRTKRQLEQRLQAILQEIEALRPNAVA
jgi:uncharacterized coiled-coil DUF342 family protein